MRPLTRPLSTQASRALISKNLTVNASVTALPTRCTRNWCSQSRNHRANTRLSRHDNNATFKPAVRSSIIPSHPFSTTSALSKKKDKKAPPPAPNDALNADDPFDLIPLKSKTDDEVKKYKTQVSKLRTGGRFDPQLIESLRVALDKGGKETVRLGDLAQVIPKGGRMVTVLVGDEEYTKPVSSAITSSQLSLNPQADPHNALQLNVPIPPPTKESREKDVKEAKTAMEKASQAVRAVRLAHNKMLKAKGKAGTLLPDDLRKALADMEKVVEKGQKEIKELFEGAEKAIMQ